MRRQKSNLFHNIILCIIVITSNYMKVMFEFIKEMTMFDVQKNHRVEL